MPSDDIHEQKQEQKPEQKEARLPPPIEVSKDCEFFIATCQVGLHSYVLLGVDSQEGPLILGAFGKIGHPPTDGVKGEKSPLQACCGFFFGGTDAEIKAESVFTRTERKIRYKAYAIGYQHYLQFLDYMAEISDKQLQKYPNDYGVKPLPAYALVQETKDSLRLEWQNLKGQGHGDQIPNTEEKISLTSNNCRHSAIRLTDVARGVPNKKGEGISSFCFKRPPLQATLLRRRITKNRAFYILPLPPTAYQREAGEQEQFLLDIYHQLDRMVHIAQNNPVSVEKFSELKTLYQKVAPRPPEDLFEVITQIEDWENAHKKLIKTHRRFFWSPFATATETLFKNFKKQFEILKEEKGQKESKEYQEQKEHKERTEHKEQALDMPAWPIRVC